MSSASLLEARADELGLKVNSNEKFKKQTNITKFVEVYILIARWHISPQISFKDGVCFLILLCNVSLI